MASQTSCDQEDVNIKIFHAIADVFQKAQSTYAGHRKHVAVLKKIQVKALSQGYESAFNYWFNSLVTKVLPLKNGEIVGDRIVKLVAAFISACERDIRHDSDSENVTESSKEEEVFLRFMDQFIRHILRGIESKNKNVRYRVVQFLAMIMDNIGEIDESLYNTLIWSLNKRIYDKEANVRMQVVFCLTKFQDDELDDGDDTTEATKTLISLLQNDLSAEVRRAAMLNLINNIKTRPFILERARDMNQINRRLVYTRILRSMGNDCFKNLPSDVVDKLLKWGLEDRELLVRKACSKLISHDWLNLLGGDLIEFLEKLDLTTSEVAAQAMECLFTTRPDIVCKVKFPSDIWLELTVEISFLSSCLYTHCLKNKLYDLIDTNFPEASKWADYLALYVKKRFSESHRIEFSQSDLHNLEFIIRQLLITANKYDFSDEIGRRSMLTVIRNMLGIFELSESLIDMGLQVLKTLSINEKDFVTMAIEIINDIRDEDIDMQEQEEAKQASQINSDEEQDDDIESFRRDVENGISGKESPSEKNLMKTISQQKEARPETILACLTRSSHMLALVQMPIAENILVTSLIESLIMPAVRNNDSKIRELGVMNLGLCCLLDLQLATDNMYILGMCVSKGNAPLKQIALKVIIDIFSVHGLAVVDGKGKVDSISLHKIFYKVLKNHDLPDCQVVAAEGLCKLFLADIFTDDDLFETLVLSYFSPVNCSNEALIQAFAFCIPVYCFSHINHQMRLSRIAADVLLRLCMLWDDLQASDEFEGESRTMLKPNLILQQLLYWTDPRKQINYTEWNAEKSTVQLEFLLDFMKILPRVEKKDIKKLLLTNINSAFISANQNYDKLRELADHVEDLVENENLDSVSRHSLHKFRESMVEILDAAYDKQFKKDNDDESGIKDDKFYRALEADDNENQIEDENDLFMDKDHMLETNNQQDSADLESTINTTRKRKKLEDEDIDAKNVLLNNNNHMVCNDMPALNNASNASTFTSCTSVLSNSDNDDVMSVDTDSNSSND